MFDVPQIIQTNSEPNKEDLNLHYKAIFPEYDWKPHADYISIAKEATWFYDDIRKAKNKRWVTILGQSGTGKSEWGKRIIKKLVDEGYQAQRWDWSNVCEYFQKGDYGILEHLRLMPILVIDEIGKSTWNVGNEKLSHLLEQRLGKWTFCISNRSRRDIADNIDTRIASRLQRDENRLLELSNDCPDYSILNQK